MLITLDEDLPGEINGVLQVNVYDWLLSKGALAE